MVKVVFINIILWVAISSALAQNPFVKLEVTPKTVEKGQSVSITIKTNVDGKMDMNLPDEFIQSGAMQSGMSSSIAYINGRQQAVRYNYQSFTGYFEKEDTYLIGPVKVQTRNGEVSSKPQKVKVIKRQNMISEDPAENLNQLMFGIIEQSKKALYEGEPLILEGKVYSQVEVLQVEGFNPFKFNGSSDDHALVNPNRVSSSYEVINGKNIQTFRIGKTLLFPEKIGSYDISPFESVLLYNDPRTHYPERAKITSNETKVNIKPLPAGMPKFFIGAVGEFNLSAHFLNTNADQGKVVELRVKVSGHGNLHNIERPTIYLPKGLTFYGDPEISDSINYTPRGAEGSKSFTYFIQVNRAGNIYVNPIKIAYFDPKSEEYKTVECKVKPLSIKSNGEDIEEVQTHTKEEVRTPTMQPYITERTEEVSSPPLFHGWPGAAILFTPVMLGFVIGFGVRIKKQNEEKSAEEKARIQHKTDSIAQLYALKKEQNNSDKIIHITRLLVGFLAKEFNVDNGEISRLFLKSKVPQEISEEMNAKIVAVLDELDAMKYGGSLNQSDVNHIIDEVESIIKSFE